MVVIPPVSGTDLARDVLRRMGTDRAVLYGVLAKVAGGVFGLATIVLIAWRFPLEMQGYYYTFANLVALQVFAELGLGVVVVQFASHYWARLRLDADGRIEGDPDARSRLVSLGRLAMRWYAVAGIAAAVLICLSGYGFFSRASGTIPWQGPWIVLCALAGLRLASIPAWSLLEGCNQVSSVYLFRFLSSLVAGLVATVAIVGGLGLWTPTLAVGAELAVGLCLLVRRHQHFLLSFRGPARGQGLDWRTDILPLQSRVALTWLASYFTSAVFTPLLFYHRGAAEAGQWGMTWSMFGMVTSVSLTWVIAKAPQFGMLVARRDFALLDIQFVRQVRTSFTVAVAGAAAVWISIYLLKFSGSSMSSRVLPPDAAGLLAVSVVLMNVPLAQSVYLRAHKQEPYLVPSLIQSLVLGSTALVVAPRWGALGIAAAYLTVMVVVVVPWAIAIWIRCRAAWHAPETAPTGS
jgi:hypothetical protein